MKNEFKKFDLKKRLTSMIKVDFRRMFTTSFFYIMIGICFIIPILILVMTTMMDGTTTTNPQTGEVTVMQGFDNVWQSIGTISSAEQTMSMDLVSMCNINLVYFILAVLVCIFVADDFRSGYSKNLFTVRSKKSDYVISKTLVLFTCGSLMLLAYFIGSLIGGAISSLSFELVGVNFINIVMCMLSKILLVAVFTPIFLVMSVVGKQKVWLSMILAFGTSMLLFTMIPMISPLDSTIMNVILSLAGGALFSYGLGLISNKVLEKTSLV